MHSLLIPIVSLVSAAEGGAITIFVQRSMGNRYPLARIFSVAVLPVQGEFQRGRQHSATTAHRALPVCEWPALGMPLQGQMQPLQCAAVVKRPALGAAAGLCRWFIGGAVLPVCGNFQRRSHYYSATTAHRALPVCGWPALGIPWGTARTNAGSAV